MKIPTFPYMIPTFFPFIYLIRTEGFQSLNISSYPIRCHFPIV